MCMKNTSKISKLKKKADKYYSSISKNDLKKDLKKAGFSVIDKKKK